MQPSEAIIEKTVAEGYRIERFSAEHINDLVYLHATIYGTLPDKEYFRKKYNTTHMVVAYTGYLAYDDSGLPAAFYGVIPCFVEYEKHLVLAAQSADTMTHPNHRNKGLFIALANETIALCQKEGIKLLFGFPNQHSLHGFVNKIGWEVCDTLQRFTFDVKTISLQKFAAKFSPLQALYNSYFERILKPAANIKGIAAPRVKGYARVYRDKDYLAYKTYNQTYVIKEGGVSVWLKIQNNSLVIGDLTGKTDNAALVLNKLLDLAKKAGLKQVHFQTCCNTALYRELEKHVAPVASFPVIVKDLGSNIPMDKLSFTFADIDIF